METKDVRNKLIMNMNYVARQEKLLICSLVILLAMLATNVQAGVLVDMGVIVGNNNGTTYAMQGGQTAGQLSGQNITGQSNLGPTTLYYNIEDQNDTAATDSFLGPRYGGQDYDAEFLGVTLSGTKLSIGILTGQRFDNGLSNFSPGDIRITTNMGEFWVEVGGSSGAGNGVISLGENGSTYTLNSSSGFTSSVSNSSLITAGTVLKNPNVINAVPGFNPPLPVQINPNTPLSKIVGTADTYSYTFFSGSQHAGIEATFDAASLLGLGTIIQSVEWRPSCGNDQVLYLGINEAVTPEPSSLLIWGGIAMAAGAYSLRRRTKQAIKPAGELS